jgi:hypothetical protein
MSEEIMDEGAILVFIEMARAAEENDPRSPAFNRESFLYGGTA